MNADQNIKDLSTQQKLQEHTKTLDLALQINPSPYLDNQHEIKQQLKQTKISVPYFKQDHLSQKSKGCYPQIKQQEQQQLKGLQSRQMSKKQVFKDQQAKQQNKTGQILNNQQDQSANTQKFNKLMSKNEELINKIDRYEEIINILIKKTDLLQQENNKINLQLKNIRQEFKKEIDCRREYQHQVLQVKQQIKQLNENYSSIISKIGQKCQVQQNKMMRIYDLIQEANKRQVQSQLLNIQSRISQQMIKKQKNGFDEPSNKKQLSNAERIQNLNLPIVELKSVPINYTGSTTNYYMIDSNERQTTLVYIGQSGTWTHIFGRDRIDPYKIVQFVFKIKNSASNAISFGIIDKKYEKLRSCGKKETNCIFYYGGSGRLWESGRKLEKQGRGFREGDVVTMIVLLSQGAIRWYVNGILQSQYNSGTALKHNHWKQIQWVPFVNMSTNKDIVVWQFGQ